MKKTEKHIEIYQYIDIEEIRKIIALIQPTRKKTASTIRCKTKTTSTQSTETSMSDTKKRTKKQ